MTAIRGTSLAAAVALLALMLSGTPAALAGTTEGIDGHGHVVSFAPPAVHSATHSTAHSPLDATTVTDNWAGYVANGGVKSFTSAQSTFIVPELVTCAPNQNTASAFWAGLDGWTSGTVEQDGVAADCNDGTPQYFAWWEDLPLDSGTFLTVVVHSGDSVTASVVFVGNSSYTLQVTDTTSNTSGSETVTEPGGDDSSAECIAEDPGGATTSIPYANYGTVAFTGCTANGAPIGSFSPLSTDTVTPQGALDAVTSGLSGGTSFSVQRVIPPPSTPGPQPAAAAGPPLALPVVGLASTPSGNGYWAANAYGSGRGPRGRQIRRIDGRRGARQAHHPHRLDQ